MAPLRLLRLLRDVDIERERVPRAGLQRFLARVVLEGDVDPARWLPARPPPAARPPGAALRASRAKAEESLPWEELRRPSTVPCRAGPSPAEPSARRGARPAGRGAEACRTGRTPRRPGCRPRRAPDEGSRPTRSSIEPPTALGVADEGSTSKGRGDPPNTADQNACATSGWAMSLCAPAAPPPFLMMALDSRL